jgi:hypothetical protein
MSIVIAFISKSFNGESDPEKYKFPDDPTKVVLGRQTNEAPIKYLLQRDPSIQKIICICTKEVKEKHSNSPKERSVYEYLEDELKKYYRELKYVPDRKLECVPVDFEGDNFEQEVIPKILELVQPDDKIYLETTGGPRNAVSQLILLAQVLEYQKQETRLLGAVYSNRSQNKDEQRIVDVTNDYRVFNLITALNEFQHIGGTGLLEEYYKGSDLTVTSLIDAMKKLSECIVLCNIQQKGSLGERINNFQQALGKAKNANDPMFRVLLPIFEEKFSFLNSVPDIVRWCLENNLVLQALTIYNDCIPEYIIEQKHILDIPDNIPQNPPKNKNRYVYALADNENGFFSLGSKINKKKKWYSGEYLVHNLTAVNNPEFAKLKSLFQDGKTFNGFHVNISRQDMRDLCINYMYINLLRNYLCHDGSEDVKKNSRYKYLTKKCGKPKFDDITVQRVRTVMRDALNQLEKCAATANKGTSHP